MNSRILFRVAAPMMAVSLLLLVLGLMAAWNVHKQQQTNSDLIAREVNGIVATEDLFIAMREIRSELDLFLRTNDRKHLAHIDDLLDETMPLLHEAIRLARTPEERQLIGVVSQGYEKFSTDFHLLAKQELTPAVEGEFTQLNDVFLTQEILVPAQKCVSFNRQVVEKANESSRVVAQHMRMGFLLIGICGSIAGVLAGLGIARAVSRSIVQLHISVRDVTGKLSEVCDPVTISHAGDFQGLEHGLKTLEAEISQVLQRLQQRETELLRCEQLASVGQLAAALAHELRNPLMPMKILVQAALERGPEGRLQGRQLAVIRDEICRLEKSIQIFLDFARPPELKKSTISVASIIYATIDLLSPRACQQEVELHCVIPREPVIAQIDADQFRQVLVNLLLNSLDELPSGGLVEVQLLPADGPPSVAVSAAVATHRLSEPFSEHDALRLVGSPASEDSMFTLRVVDTGPGFKPEIASRLFQPFATTKETGMGLGLSMCQRIVTAHQGSITARNRPQGGVEFVIRLPYGKNIVAPSPTPVSTLSLAHHQASSAGSLL